MDLILQSQRSRDLRFLKAVLQFNTWIRLTLLRLACRQLPLWEPSTAVRLWLSILLWNNYRVTLHHILHVCDKRRWNRLVEPTTWSDGLKVIKAWRLCETGLRGTEQLKRLTLNPFTLSQQYKLSHAQVGPFTCRTRSRAVWEKTSSDLSLVPNLNQDSQGSERRLRGTTPCTGCWSRLPSRREILRVPRN